ncbi:MAG: methyltransferase domain-containing protein [Paracoccaceae bacterium]
MSVLKQIERYWSAVFKLGRISRQAKRADYAVGLIEPRLDALSDDLHALSARQVEVAHLRDRMETVEAAVPALSVRVDGLFEELRGHITEVFARRGEENAARFASRSELENVAGRLDAGDAERRDLAGRLDAGDAERRDLGGRLGATEARQTELAVRQDALSARQGELAARTDTVQLRLDAAEREAAALRERQTALETDLTRRLDALTEALAAHTDHFRGLEEAFRTHKETAQSRLDALAEGARGSEARIGAAEGWLDTLSKDLGRQAEDTHRRLAAVEGGAGGAGSEFQNLEAAYRAHAEDTHRRLETVEREVGERLKPGLADAEAETDRLAGYLKALEDAQRRSGDDTHRRLVSLEMGRSADLGSELQRLDARLDRMAGDQAQIGRAYADLSRRVDLQRFGAPDGPAEPPFEEPVRREGLDALLDAFYGRLEDRYRGSRAEIKKRLRVYLGDVREAIAETRPADGSALGVLDMGCGRGEWLELLADEGVAATGVDLNPVQIAEAVRLGLDVREGDALRALAEAADGSLAIVTAHHLIEHLSFDAVTWMAREALRALAPGGLLLFETPNPRNLIVGASTFHLDPTHRRPVPSEVLTTLFDTLGFHPVEARHLHPSETLEAFASGKRADPYVSDLLFGPQDLAVLGRKPRER